MKFKSDIEVQAGIKDYSGSAGTSGQVLSTSGTSVSWVDPALLPAESAENLITEVYNETGATLTKGTIVYINGGHGNLPTITKALATSDATSAQTYGIVRANITTNNNGWVVVTGRLTDLDTQAYSPGTVLYLSSTTAGQWTSTKQYAPNHLVYVGIVVRSHPTQGVVEVKIQNGYELDELHNVSAQTPSNNNGIFYNTATSLWEAKSISAAGGVEGSGTTNYVSKFIGTTTLGNSLIFDNGSGVGISTTNPILGSGLTIGNDALGSATVKLAFSTSAAERGSLSMNGSSGEMRITSGYSGYGGFTTFYNNGSERMRIDSDGNILVGQTSAIYSATNRANLTIGKSAGSIIVLGTSTASNGYLFYNNTDVELANSTSSGSVFFRTAGTERMRITSGGNVGIGTSAPNAKLEVSAGQSFINQDYLLGWNVAGSATLRAYIIGTSGNELQFWNRQGGTNTQAITLNASGNVGIGTTSPLSKLHVSDTSGGTIYIQDSDSTSTYSITSISNSGGNLSFDTRNSSGTFVSTDYQIVKDSAGANYQRWFTAGSERMRIDAGGGVGIGTTSITDKLTVSGDIRATDGTNYIKIGQWDGVNNRVEFVNRPLRFAGYYGNSDIIFANNSDIERMRIATSGNVGIGTSVPATRFDVQLATNKHILFHNGNGEAEILGTTDNGSAYVPLFISASPLVLNVNNGSNVGIGISNPNSKLEVYDGDISVTTANSFSFLNSNRNFIPNTGGVSLGALRFRGYSTGTTYQVGSAIYSFSQEAWTSTSTPGYLSFQTTTAGSTSPSEKMILTAAGNVGIGTSAPSEKLEVLGAIRLTRTDDTAQFCTIQSTSASGFLSTSFRPYAGAGLYGEYRFDAKDSTGGTITPLYINTLGNVGIGTTSPVVKLQVNGTITSTGALTAYTSVPSINIGHNGDSAFIASTSGDGANTPISFSVGNNAEKMRITVSGNVGIGTSAPANKLVATSDASPTSENTYAIAAAAASDPAYKTVIGYDLTNDIGLIAAVRTSIGWRNISMPQGSLGIGNVGPTEKLHVTGNIRVTGSYYDSSNSQGTSGQVLSSTGSGTDWVSLSEITGVDGTGTANYVSKWLDANTITNSLIYDNGTNVGINTTDFSDLSFASPAFKVAGSRATLGLMSSGSLSTLAMQALGGPQIHVNYDTTGALSIYQYSAGSETFRLNPSGNVGIGTSSPNSKLSISYSSAVVDALNIINTNTNGRSWYVGDGAGVVAGTFGFYDATAALSRLVINATGNVGIGATSPVSIGTGITTLDIQGSAAGGIAFGLSGTKNYIYGASTMYVEAHTTAVFATSGSEKMRLTTGGQLIVGGTTVGYSGTKLQVGNTSDSQNGLNILTSTSGYGYVLFGDGSGADTYVGQIWYKHGDDYMGFQTNGSEKMRITSGGNVGIGTSSPGTQLEILGTDNSGARDTPYNVLTVTADNPNAPYGGFGGAMLFKNRAYTSGIVNSSRVRSQINNNSVDSFGGSLHFDVTPTVGGSLTEAMMINYNGNVGIGTTSPTAKLHVAGNSQLISSNEGIAGNNDFANYAIKGSSTGSSLIFNWYSGHIFQTDGGSERMRITSTGNVGIGTSAPSAMLTLNGTTPFIRIERSGVNTWQIQNNYLSVQNGFSVNNITAGTTPFFIGENGNVGIGTTSPSSKLHISGSGNTETIIDATTSGSPILSMLPTSGGNSLIAYGETGALRFGTVSGPNGTGLSEKIRITSGGNVGIGTSSPGAKLDVEAATTGYAAIIKNTTAGGDYLKMIGDSGNTVFEFGSGGTGGDAFLNMYADNTQKVLVNADGNSYFNGGNVGVGTTSPAQKLDVVGNAKVSGSVQVGDDSTTASASNVGATRYRSDSNNSYMDMVMQTGASTYAWVNVVQNTWV